MAAVLGSLVIAVALIQHSRHQASEKEKIVQQMQTEHKEAVQEAEAQQQFQYSDVLHKTLQSGNQFFDYQSDQIFFPKPDSTDITFTQTERFQEIDRQINPLGVAYTAPMTNVARLTPSSIEQMPGGERPTQTSIPQVGNEQSFGTLSKRTSTPYYEPKWKNMASNVLPNPRDNKDPDTHYYTGESTVPSLFNTMPDRQNNAELWLERDVKKKYDYTRQENNPYSYEFTSINRNKANANAPLEMAPFHHKSNEKLSQLNNAPFLQKPVKPTNESGQEWTDPQPRGTLMPKPQPGVVESFQPRWMNAQSAETNVRSGDKSDRVPRNVSYSNANNGSNSSAKSIMQSANPYIYIPAPDSKILKNERDNVPLPNVYAPSANQSFGTHSGKSFNAATVRASIPVDSKRDEGRFIAPFGGQGRDGNPYNTNSPFANSQIIRPAIFSAKDSKPSKQQLSDHVNPAYSKGSMERVLPVYPDVSQKDIAKRKREENQQMPLMYNTASGAIGGNINSLPLHTVSAPVIETRR